MADSTTTLGDERNPYWYGQVGVAPVKSEYVLWDRVKSGPGAPTSSASTSIAQATSSAPDDDAAEGRTFSTTAKHGQTLASTSTSPSTMSITTKTEDKTSTEHVNGSEQPVKKARLSGAEKKKLAKAKNEAQWKERQQAKADKANIASTSQEGDATAGAIDTSAAGSEGGKKRKGGQNKGRTFHHAAGTEAVRLCNNTARGLECTKDQCKWDHDLADYMMTARQEDVSLTLPTSQDDLNSVTSPHPCPSFKTLGRCPSGFKCRFGASHIRKLEPGQGFRGSGYELIVDDEKVQKVAEALGKGTSERGEYNLVDIPTMKLIRGQGGSKEERFPLAQEYLTSIGEVFDTRELGGGKGGKNGKRGRHGEERNNGNGPKIFVAQDGSDVEDEPPSRTFVPDLAKIRFPEKKRLDWRGKLYMAPLTTVGNLPFRRLAVDYGCDITCSEMGLAQEFLNGNSNEWSLVRRHPSEKMFGVQICGSRPQVLVPAAEGLRMAIGDRLDFVDVNCGCPIDLVFNKGAGSALLTHATKLGKSLAGMSQVLGDIPLTIKIRNGVSHNTPVAHKLMPRLQQEWGVSAVTHHGRSRAQRYKQMADYAYIGQCAKVLRESAADEGLAPIPIFGNGDAYDYRSYYQNMEDTGVDGIMIARGALIKPWIFTEIKERRDWDISATERLDMVKNLVDYGLEHWGSDQIGINHVRRFVCESLSFTHRYIPVGMIERFPVQLNERPLPFKGRNELETLLSSSQSSDWVKITEMFLGPPPSDWSFAPKHKANASAETEVQG